MKVYKIEIMVVDSDEVGDEMKEIIENTRYPDRCISPEVMKIESREIGEWHDNHPLNKYGEAVEYYEKIFNT